MKNNIILIFVIALISVSFVSCEIEETPIPTHELMQGVWELTEAYDANDSSIIEGINGIFPTYVHLDGNNSMLSTASPLFMYIVYGNSKFSKVTTQLDNAFGYLNNEITQGEFFMVKNEVVDNFTIEYKMKFIGMSTLTTILDMMGINKTGILEEVIYHKFRDVGVFIEDDNAETMTWVFDDYVLPIYNVKDQYGDYVLWNGISVDTYSRCTLVFKKRVQTINQLVQDYNDGLKK
jgi:hypothetical protein